jgi:hypothetical protein
MARLQADATVESAWVDHAGAALVVFPRAGAEPAAVAATVRAALAPSYGARELSAPEAADAVRAP